MKLGDQVDVEKGTLTAPCLAGAEEVVNATEAFFGSTVARPDAEPERLNAAQRELHGKACVDVVALQYGGDARTLDALIRSSSCSVSDLFGCNELLEALSDYSSAFYENLEPPALSGFGGWAPTSAFYTDEIQIN